jgi:quercetin dioxygenase-like cupin family protein
LRRLFIALSLALVFGAHALAQAPSVVLENDRVRVSRVSVKPHDKFSWNWQTEFVTVYLTEVHERVTTLEGKPREFRKKAGETSHGASGARVEENLANQPFEYVVVELKKRPEGTAPYTFSPTTDPAKIDRKYHTVDFENESVRVLRTVLAPHIKSPMHAHPGYAVVYLTDLHTKMSFPDGTVTDNVRKKGDIAWRDALQHSTENVGEERAEEIQVEMK